MSIRALTWDHPRGYLALEAAVRQWAAEDGVDISWSRQPLEGFESQPIEDLCRQYDVLVLDHPHLGEAVRADALQPMDVLMGSAAMADLRAHTVGRCLASYELDGTVWALPLDAASQVTALRPDLGLIGDQMLWSEVVQLSRDTGRVALSMAGPHALVTLTSMAVALGHRPAEGDPDVYFEMEVGKAAVDLLYTLAARSPAVSWNDNPIELLTRMSRSHDVMLCPLIFGYVSFAAADAANRLAFRNAPRATTGGVIGSVLGGTGIAITKRCHVTAGLITHLRRLLGSEAQQVFIPTHGGQPSRRTAWMDAEVNARWGQFYLNTLDALESAYVRPRYDGYMNFQRSAAGLVREAALARPKPADFLESINRLHRRCQPRNPFKA